MPRGQAPPRGLALLLSVAQWKHVHDLNQATGSGGATGPSVSCPSLFI